MDIGSKWVSAKNIGDLVLVYTVKMFNDDVVCLSYIANGQTFYSVIKRLGFETEFLRHVETIKHRYDRESFQQAARPMMEWLADNTDPHHKAIIDYSWAELISGEMSYKTEDFIRD